MMITKTRVMMMTMMMMTLMMMTLTLTFLSPPCASLKEHDRRKQAHNTLPATVSTEEPPVQRTARALQRTLLLCPARVSGSEQATARLDHKMTRPPLPQPSPALHPRTRRYQPQQPTGSLTQIHSQRLDACLLPPPLHINSAHLLMLILVDYC